uniref:hypothetical protein n=1 Tax=Flavobacterium sp. TaxID=239 RepID=UPI0040472232
KCDLGHPYEVHTLDLMHKVTFKPFQTCIIENIIDDNRSENAFGLMMSLNMNIETPEGFDFSAADFDGWAKECGFTQTSVMPLTGPSSAVIAMK